MVAKRSAEIYGLISSALQEPRGETSDEKMRYAVLGDIHANLEALRSVLDEIERLDVDRLICLGDIVGYNADPEACVDLLRESDFFSIVRGNHDDMAGRDVGESNINPLAAISLDWTRRRLRPDQKEWLLALPLVHRIDDEVTICHSSLDDPGRWPYLINAADAVSTLEKLDTRVCFYGHVHKPRVFSDDLGFADCSFTELDLEPGIRYLINVGSVGQPRDGDPRAAFAVYDQAAGRAVLHRVRYDIEATRRKILDAGLPKRLADRLSVGS